MIGNDLGNSPTSMIDLAIIFEVTPVFTIEDDFVAELHLQRTSWKS